MAFIVSACADQAELINRSLPSQSSPCSLIDVLPGLESDLNKLQFRQALTDGKKGLPSLIGKESPLLKVLEEFVWNAVNPFGSVVNYFQVTK
jgi:hypothetical protein